VIRWETCCLRRSRGSKGRPAVLSVMMRSNQDASSGYSAWTYLKVYLLLEAVLCLDNAAI